MIKIENHEVVGWEHAIRGMRNPKNSWDRIDSFSCDGTVPIFEGCEDCPMNPGEDTDEVRSFSAIPKCKREEVTHVVGPNDHELMSSLSAGGPVHAKYRRMITVYLDITAPLYWWKEFDTYKVGTVANSCSTMHMIHAKEFTLEDFSHEHLMGDNDYYEKSSCLEEDFPVFEEKGGRELFWTPINIMLHTIQGLNFYRQRYLEAKTKPMKEESKRVELMKKYWWQMIQLLPSSYNQKRTIMLNYEVLANIYRWRKNHKLDEWVEFCKWIEQLPYSEIITGGCGND